MQHDANHGLFGISNPSHDLTIVCCQIDLKVCIDKSEAYATDPEGRAGLPLPGLYALQAQRYRDVYGATPEQFAEVAVKNKANGTRNPRAQLRGSAPSNAEVLASRMIAEPLTFLQCCPVSDGAGAMVLGDVVFDARSGSFGSREALRDPTGAPISLTTGSWPVWPR